MYYRLSKHYLSWPCTTLLGRPDATKFINISYHNPEPRKTCPKYSMLQPASLKFYLGVFGPLGEFIGGIFTLFALPEKEIFYVANFGQCAMFQTMFHIFK